jgi:iduronate 2-sulfatase
MNACARGILLLLLCSGCVATASPRPTALNVLLLCVDDLKPALGCYGDRRARTPHLDRLAARGMRFDRAYCNQSLCSPSRNNLLLGSRSTSLGIYNLSRHFRKTVPDAVTLPQYFLRHGWRTEAVGKIFHTTHGNYDDVLSWSVPTRSEKVVEYLDPKSTAGGQLTREEALFADQRLGEIASLPRGAAWESLDVPDAAYADGRTADEGIRRLQAARMREGTPFFLALGFIRPHLPFSVPKRFWDLHDPEQLPLAENQVRPANAPAYAGKEGGQILNYEPLTAAGLRDPATQRKLLQGYYAAVSYADAQVGRVLDELDRLGLTERTIVVLWGDHGWHLGDHGIWTKHTNYEEANRIPLLVAAPGITRPGSSTGQLVETVDVFPTLAELAGLPAPTGPQPIDGLSLVPVLRDPSTRIRSHVAHCYPRGAKLGRAIRTERHRLVEWKVPGADPESAELELYDYEADPLETRDLARSQPEVVAKMRAILAGHPEARRPEPPR